MADLQLCAATMAAAAADWWRLGEGVGKEHAQPKLRGTLEPSGRRLGPLHFTPGQVDSRAVLAAPVPVAIAIRGNATSITPRPR